MFNDLQQQRTGLRSKERSRLVVTVAACLVLGGAIYGAGRFTKDEAPLPNLPDAGAHAAAKEALHELDLAPFAAIRAGTVGPAAFDGRALDHALEEIASGKLARSPKLVLEPKEVLALDPKEAAGTLLEVVGTVRSLEKEAYVSRDNPAADRLWSFALEGADGARIVVVQGALSSNPEGGRPRDRRTAAEAPTVLEDGSFVRVRGIYLQKRTGPIGAVNLETPTPVLVGREYRLTVHPPPPPAAIADADWLHLQDRWLGSTRRVDDDAHYQLLLWMKAKGHAEILKELRSGAIPVKNWTRDTFYGWEQELKQDTDTEAPDPRKWTNAARGQVFTTTGILADYLQEDWDSIGANFYDVGVRWKYWIKSDYYANVLMMMDSAFPLSTFPGIPVPKRDQRVRVRVYGIFVRNYSYHVGPEAAAERRDRSGEITVPYFLLLHMEADAPYRSAPLVENPFFWTWVSLAVFGALFFFVMSRVEKREVAMIEETQKRIRKTSRGSVYVPKPKPGAPGGALAPEDGGPAKDRGPS